MASDNQETTDDYLDETMKLLGEAGSSIDTDPVSSAALSLYANGRILAEILFELQRIRAEMKRIRDDIASEGESLWNKLDDM